VTGPQSEPVLHPAVSALGRPVHARDRHASCPRRTVPGLAFSAGDGCFTDRLAWLALRSVTSPYGRPAKTLAGLEAPAVMAGLNDGGMIRWASGHGSGHPSVAECLRPIGKSQTGGNQQRRGFGQLADQVEQSLAG
jgi:hypothetical protein